VPRSTRFVIAVQTDDCWNKMLDAGRVVGVIPEHPVAIITAVRLAMTMAERLLSSLIAALMP